MTFQSTVGFRYTTGFVGEAQADVPSKVRAWRLSAQTAVANTVGKAFTYSADAAPLQGNQGSMLAAVGGAGAFAGILVHPKHYALNGTAAGGPLAASLDLPPSSEAELMTMGNVIVNFTTAVTYGDPVYFIPATGVLTNVVTGNTLIANARVLTTTTGAGLAVISLDE